MGPTSMTRVPEHVDNSSGSNNNKLHILNIGEKLAHLRKEYVFQDTAKHLIHFHSIYQSDQYIMRNVCI